MLWLASLPRSLSMSVWSWAMVSRSVWAQVRKGPRVSPGASRGDMAAADLFLLVRALVIRVRGAAEPGLRAALQRRGRLLQLRLLLQAVLICAAPQSASVQSVPRGQRRVASAG